MLRAVLMVSIASSLLMGCSTPFEKPVFASNNAGSTEFSGIGSLLEKNATVDVLLVHGMCTHDAEWAKTAVQNIQSALGLSGEIRLHESPVEGTDVLLYQQTLQSSRSSLRVNAIVWSPLTTPLKAQLCYDQTKKSPTCKKVEGVPPYPYRRATLNRVLKDTILNDCLSDAIVYQGKSRDEINRQMQEAVLEAVATSGGQPKSGSKVAAAAAVPQSVPLVVVSESLGSKVAFDALYKLVTKPATAAAGTKTWDRVTQIFMGANQLPILALGDTDLNGTVSFDKQSEGYPQDPIGALTAARKSIMSLVDGAAPKLPQVVAFTDPNDLLSYILAPSPHAASAGYPVVDAIVSNDKTYLGLVELPTTAHMGYRENDAVRRLIACGNPKSAACK
jgi:hypothetical protein